MPNLPIVAPEDATFSDEVFRLETTTPVLGHSGGNFGESNQQAMRLLENDIFLKKKVDDLASGEGLDADSITRTKIARGVLPAGIPRNTVISGPYTAGVRSLLGSSGSALTHGAFRVTFAKGYDDKGPIDYFGAASAANAQNVSTAGVYYAFARMDESTGAVDVRLTDLAPVYSPVAPSSPANFQRWYDTANEVMKYWDSGTSAWVETLSVFIGKARKLGGGTWTEIETYEYRRDTNLESNIPAGTITPYAGAEAPAGWVMCDGQERNIADFPRLYAAIGLTYGGDAEAGYFQTPDLRGRVPVGADNMSGLAAGRVAAAWGSVLGGHGGSDTVTLTVSQIPAHGHPYRSGVASVSSADGDGGFVRDSNMASNISAHSGAVSDTDGQQIGGTGGGQSHNNMQPGQTVNYIIKA